MKELLLELAATGMEVGKPTVKPYDAEEQALRAEAAKILGNLDTLYCDRVARERSRSDAAADIAAILERHGLATRFLEPTDDDFSWARDEIAKLR